MQRKAEVFLLDIQRAADYLIRRTKDVDLSEYLQNEDLRFAVERNFILIGEAMAHLRRHYPHVSAKLEHETSIIAFRNFIIHQYWSIDDMEVWSILVASVPPLRDAIALLLASIQQGPRT